MWLSQGSKDVPPRKVLAVDPTPQRRLTRSEPQGARRSTLPGHCECEVELLVSSRGHRA